MKLTTAAIELINTKRGRALLALAMGKDVKTIERYLAANHENLTKAAALKVIREETGLSDQEILEDAEKVAA